jgi:hypothetical protein
MIKKIIDRNDHKTGAIRQGRGVWRHREALRHHQYPFGRSDADAVHRAPTARLLEVNPEPPGENPPKRANMRRSPLMALPGLPPVDRAWPIDERERWLPALAMAIGIIYAPDERSSAPSLPGGVATRGFEQRKE